MGAIETILNFQLSNYIGKVCIFCKHKYDSVEDIKKFSMIFAGKNVYGEDLFSCKDCWKNHIKQGGINEKNR